MRALLATLLLCALATPAFATEPEMADRHGPGTQWYQPKPFAKRVKVEQTHQRAARHVRKGIERATRIAEHTAAQVVAHPPGCPSRQFCGCGVSVRVFGKPVRELYLAANWSRFPPASPAPGKVAWRRGHVFYIEQNFGDGTVLAYDPNSGRHLTRIHRRSLAGYRVVDPHASRYAVVEQ